MGSDVPDGDADPETKSKQSQASRFDIHKSLTSRAENEALLLSLFTLCRVWSQDIHVHRSAA